MSTAVQTSTIDLLETELSRARNALHEIQSKSIHLLSLDNFTTGALAARKKILKSYNHDFFAGSARLTPKELGLVSLQEITPPPEEDVKPPSSDKSNNIFSLLANSVVLHHLVPLLPISSLIALASTSKAVRSVLFETPYGFRHLDLSTCQVAQIPERQVIDAGGEQWRNERMGESLTEDEFYAGPLRGIFSRLYNLSVLTKVRTLVLDGLSVPAELVTDILLSARFNVSILSIRDCTHLNERLLRQALEYAVRPGRPEGTPKIKGVYFFTSMASTKEESPSRWTRSRREWWRAQIDAQKVAPTSSEREQPDQTMHKWYKGSGKIFKSGIDRGWGQTLKKCENIIAFDTVLCRGPRHNPDLYVASSSSENQTNSKPANSLLPATIATISIGPHGCDGCRTAPEGPAIWGESPESFFPLLTPSPLFSSNILNAKRPVPRGETAVMIARCEDCLESRWCHQCHKWFCEDCLPIPEEATSRLSPHQTVVHRAAETKGQPRDLSPKLQNIPGVSRDCWECGPTVSLLPVSMTRVD